jgi:hypothetical protein
MAADYNDTTCEEVPASDWLSPHLHFNEALTILLRDNVQKTIPKQLHPRRFPKPRDSPYIRKEV